MKDLILSLFDLNIYRFIYHNIQFPFHVFKIIGEKLMKKMKKKLINEKKYINKSTNEDLKHSIKDSFSSSEKKTNIGKSRIEFGRKRMKKIYIFEKLKGNLIK